MSALAAGREQSWSMQSPAMSSPSLSSIMDLPMAWRCLIASYLPLQDKVTIIRRLNRDFCALSRHPSSWTKLHVNINGRTLSATMHGAADCFKHARAVTIGACDSFSQSEWSTLMSLHSSASAVSDGRVAVGAAQSFLSHFMPNVSALTLHCQTSLKRQSAAAIATAFDSLTRLHTLTLTGDITSHIVTALAHSSLTHLDLRTAVWHAQPPQQQQQQQIPQHILQFITGAQQQNAMAAFIQQQQQHPGLNFFNNGNFNMIVPPAMPMPMPMPAALLPPLPQQRVHHQQQTQHRQAENEVSASSSSSRVPPLLTPVTLITHLGPRLRTLHLPIITLSDGATATAADTTTSDEILAAIADTHSVPTSRLHTLTVAQNTSSLGLLSLKRCHNLIILDLSHCLYVQPNDVITIISHQLLLKCLALPHFLTRNNNMNHNNNSQSNKGLLLNNNINNNSNNRSLQSSVTSSLSSSTNNTFIPLTINQSFIDAISQLIYLEQLLTHAYSEFDDDISTHSLTALKYLTVLRLRGCTLYNHISPLISSNTFFKYITIIDFTQSYITDYSIEQICHNMTRLIYITLDHCQELTVKSIFYLSHLTELSALSIDHCPSMTVTKVAMNHHKKIDDLYYNNDNNNNNCHRSFPRLTYLSCRINDATLWDFPGFNQLLLLLNKNIINFVNIEPLYEPQPLLYLHTMMQHFPYIRWLVSAEKLCNTSEVRIIKKELMEQINRVENISATSVSLYSSINHHHHNNVNNNNLHQSEYYSQSSLLQSPFLPHWNEDEIDFIQRIEREDDDDKHKAVLYQHDTTYAKPRMAPSSMSSSSSTTTSAMVDTSSSPLPKSFSKSYSDASQANDATYMRHATPLRLSWCDILPSALAQHSSALYTFRSETHRTRFMDLIAKRLQSITEDEQRREALMDDDGNVPPANATDAYTIKTQPLVSSTTTTSTPSSCHSPSSSTTSSPDELLSLMRNDLFDAFADDFELKADDENAEDDFRFLQSYVRRPSDYELPVTIPAYSMTSSSSSSSSYNERMGTSDLYGQRFPDTTSALRNDRAIAHLRRHSSQRLIPHDLRARPRAVRSARRRQSNGDQQQMPPITTSFPLATGGFQGAFVTNHDDELSETRLNAAEPTTTSLRYTLPRRRMRSATIPADDRPLTSTLSSAPDASSLNTQHNGNTVDFGSWIIDDDISAEKKTRREYDQTDSNIPRTPATHQPLNSFSQQLDDHDNNDDNDADDDDDDDDCDIDDILEEEDINRF